MSYAMDNLGVNLDCVPANTPWVKGDHDYTRVTRKRFLLNEELNTILDGIINE